MSIDAKLNQQKKEQLKNKQYTQILREGHNHIYLEIITSRMGKANDGALASSERAFSSYQNYATRR